MTRYVTRYGRVIRTRESLGRYLDVLERRIERCYQRPLFVQAADLADLLSERADAVSAYEDWTGA